MLSLPTYTDEKTLWTYLGTFYSKLDFNSKKIIENYWKYLIQGMNIQYYNTKQMALSNNLKYGQGYIEHGYNDLLLTPADMSIIRNDAPVISGLTISNAIDGGGNSGSVVFEYVVTGVDSFGETDASSPIISGLTVYKNSNGIDYDVVDNEISWAAVSGISSYNIYGRTPGDVKFIANTVDTFYNDYVTSASASFSSAEFINPSVSGVNYVNTTTKWLISPLNYSEAIVTMPTISGITNPLKVYTEGVDYDIYDLHYIKFKNPANLDFTKQLFLIKQAIGVPPILANVHFPGFGSSVFESIINNNNYLPNLEGYEAYSYFDSRTAYSKHLFKWAAAVVNRTMRGPTILNLKETLELFYNGAFSYEAGEVTEYTNMGSYYKITITGDSVISYKVYSPKSYTVGDTVSEYELLTSFLTIYDYTSHTGGIPVIDGFVASHPEHQLNDMDKCTIVVCSGVNSVSYTSFSSELVDESFEKNFLPPNTKIYYI